MLQVEKKSTKNNYDHMCGKHNLFIDLEEIGAWNSYKGEISYNLSPWKIVDFRNNNVLKLNVQIIYRKLTEEGSLFEHFEERSSQTLTL